MPVVVPFTIADNLLHAPQNQLTMTATVDAQSGPPGTCGTCLPPPWLQHVGGPNWTVTVTPVPDSAGGTNGIGLVDLSVSDPAGNTAATSFAVIVQATSETVFSDTFNYTSGSSLLLENGSAFGTPPTVNDGIWNAIGPSGPILNVTSNSLDFAVNANGEEGYANRLGGPYAPGHGYVIYTTFEADWASITAGNGWLSLGEFIRRRFPVPWSPVVGSIPDLAANDGGFNATIVNGPGGAAVTNPATLTPGTTYNIATRYDVDRATAAIWINAANEADPTATSVIGTGTSPGSGAPHLGHYFKSEWSRWRCLVGRFERSYGHPCRPTDDQFHKCRRRQRANCFHGGRERYSFELRCEPHGESHRSV